MHHDPAWPRASEWLASRSDSPKLAVLGAPLNRSITPGRCDLAPAAIRAVLARFSTFEFESQFDLRDLPVRDLGDADVARIAESVGLTSCPLVVLGGDNGVTRPAVNGLGVALDRVGVVTLDAHLDLRHLNDGPMNGNPIRGLLKDGVRGEHIIQIGLQSFANSAEYAGYGRSQAIRQITADQCYKAVFSELFASELDWLAERVDVVAFDLDLDVMDRAFAPGCPGSRPGGLMPWQVRQAARIAGRHSKVRMMDLVELDPELDEGDRTAMSAAACLLEFAAGVMERP